MHQHGSLHTTPVRPQMVVTDTVGVDNALVFFVAAAADPVPAVTVVVIVFQIAFQIVVVAAVPGCLLRMKKRLVSW